MEYEIRELKDIDLEDPSDFFDTLANMRDVGELTPKQAKDILLKINSQDGHILIAITPEGKIIGTATILIEQKFIRSGAKSGHLEDISVRKEFEGNGIGKAVVNKAVELAKKLGCYKIVLDSSEENRPFYEKLDFKKYGDFMKMELK